VTVPIVVLVPLTVKSVSVPTLVKLDETIPLARLVPVRSEPATDRAFHTGTPPVIPRK